jgi:hypothetical protein
VAHRFTYVDVQGRKRVWELSADSPGFTCCRVLVACQVTDAASILVERTGGSQEPIRRTALDSDDSRSIFSRAGSVSHLTVFVPQADL